MTDWTDEESVRVRAPPGNHFYEEGHGIFAKIYKDHPVDYFWGLITLAKVMKIEIGGPNEFDRPSTQEEALDRLERSAGPQARKIPCGRTVGYAR